MRWYVDGLCSNPYCRAPSGSRSHCPRCAARLDTMATPVDMDADLWLLAYRAIVADLTMLGQLEREYALFWTSGRLDDTPTVPVNLALQRLALAVCNPDDCRCPPEPPPQWGPIAVQTRYACVSCGRTANGGRRCATCGGSVLLEAVA